MGVGLYRLSCGFRLCSNPTFLGVYAFRFDFSVIATYDARMVWYGVYFRIWFGLYWVLSSFFDHKLAKYQSSAGRTVYF